MYYNRLQYILYSTVARGRPQVNISKEVLTVEEVSELLQISPEVVRKQLRQKRLLGVRVGKEWRIAKVELERYLNIGAQPEGRELDDN